MRRRLFLAAIFVLMLSITAVTAGYTAPPHPPDTPPGPHRTYFPITSGPGDPCPADHLLSTRAGLAPNRINLSYRHRLCFPAGYPVLSWQPRLQQHWPGEGTITPYFWAALSGPFNGGPVYNRLAEAQARIPAGYTGDYYLLNEADRYGSFDEGGQASLPPFNAARQIYHVAQEWPEAKLIVNCVSNAEYGGHHTTQTIIEYVEIGGDVSRFTGLCLHIYWQQPNDPGFWNGVDGDEIWPAEKIDTFYAGLEQLLRDSPVIDDATVDYLTGLPLYVTEIGYRYNMPDPYYVTRRFLEDMETHPRVARYLVYGGLDPLPGQYGTKGFGFFDRETMKLTEYGRAVRDHMRWTAGAIPSIRDTPPAALPPPGGYP